MPVTVLNERRVYYTNPSSGATTLPAVLLVHGAGGSHLDWPAKLRRLSGATVVAMDLPGHGRSQGPGRTAVSAYAGDVMALAASLGLEKYVVIGHSMGGAIGLTIALERAPELAGLVLVASGARLRVAPQILCGLVADFESTVDRIVEATWADNAPEEVRTASKTQLGITDPAVVHGDFTACDQFDVTDRLNEVVCPTAIICGTKDLFAPPKYSRYLADHIPGSRLTIVEGGGHMVALEQPDTVVRAIVDFLSDLTPGESRFR